MDFNVKSQGIQRIPIEDASGQVMPKSNAAAFPAHDNQHGKTDGVKICLKSFRRDLIDLDAIGGEQDRKCRLVAIRAAPEVAVARRAERRKKARECCKNPCPKGLL